jgi:hypothetical protein
MLGCIPPASAKFGSAGGDARILSSNPGVYLYTERQTAPLIILPIHWYRQDIPQLLAPFRSLSTYASANGLSHVYFHRSDYGSLALGHGEEADGYVQRDQGLRPVYRRGQGTVYQVVRPWLHFKGPPRR